MGVQGCLEKADHEVLEVVHVVAAALLADGVHAELRGPNVDAAHTWAHRCDVVAV